jgi:hypothetical protein
MLHEINWNVLRLQAYTEKSCAIFGLRSTLLFEIKMGFGHVS